MKYINEIIIIYRSFEQLIKQKLYNNKTSINTISEKHEIFINF